MALQITTAALAAKIRVSADPTTPPAEPELGIVEGLRSVADELINLYAPDAPDSVKDEAAVRFVGYLYDAPHAGAGVHPDAMRNSGAMSLLAWWHEGGAYAADGAVDADDTTAPETPESPLTPAYTPHPGTHYRYIGWSIDTTVTPGEVANGQQYSGDDLTIPDGGPGYVWFAVEAAAGYPDALYYAGNPTNLIGVYTQQAGVVEANLVDHLVGISASLLGENAEGIVIQLRYNP